MQFSPIIALGRSRIAHHMKLEAAKEELEKFIIQSGKTTVSLTPADAVGVMLDFYRKVRIDDVALEGSDGDMLLYQWGTYDWGHGDYFQFNITRQFIVADLDGDDGFRQLSFTCYFKPEPALDALTENNQWCRAVNNLVGFETFIRESSAYQAVGTLKPHKITIEYGGI